MIRETPNPRCSRALHCRDIEQPSAALVKPCLINGCDPLFSTERPSYESGFGLINLIQSLLPVGPAEEAGPKSIH